LTVGWGALSEIFPNTIDLNADDENLKIIKRINLYMVQISSCWQLGVLLITYSLFIGTSEKKNNQNTQEIHFDIPKVYHATQLDSSTIFSAPIQFTYDNFSNSAKEVDQGLTNSKILTTQDLSISSNVIADSSMEEQYVLCSAFPPAFELSIKLLNIVFKVLEIIF
jgi:hypothetical protein